MPDIISLIVFAQDEGGKGSGRGDSATTFVIVFAVLTVIIVVAGLLLLRARGTDQSQSPRDSHATRAVGGTGESGRPLHIDPDPDNLAGGRARMVDPKEPDR